MTEILITSSALIAALFVIRFAFRRTLSARLRYALWGLVLLRLLLPVQLPAADFSILNRTRPVQERIVRYMDAAPFPDALEVTPAPSRAAPVETPVPVRTLTASDCLKAVWFTGMAATGGAFLISNLRFRRFLYKNRKLCRDVSTSHAAYLIENGLPSPCLYGLFRPSIYLTPAAVADPERLRHVIAHEETHARHADPLWALLRCVCLTVYWFDPLVWAAALASKADCELACDEGTLARLEESERIAYGETLLSLIATRRGNPFLTATTMTAGKRQLRERITRIAKRPRQFAAVALCVVLLAAFVCACTFTGERSGNETDPAPTNEGILAGALSDFDPEWPRELDDFPAKDVLTRLKEYPDSYQEIIARDNLVIQTVEGRLLNRQLFDDFLNSVEHGQSAEVIIVQFTVEGDPCLGYLLFNGDRFFYLRDDSRDKFGGGEKYWLASYLYFQQISGDGVILHILTDTKFADYGEYEDYIEERNGDSVKLPRCVLYLPTGENIKWQDGNAVTEARKILSRAFSYDATVISDISHGNAQGADSVTVTFRDNESGADVYEVTFADGVPYPVTAYHFNGYADLESIDIASDESFSYDTDMTEAAKDFVKTVCGVDCPNANVSAYGYRNKVCVALESSENEFFLVSFHYKDLNPVGIRVAFDKSLVEKTMELEKARLLYLDSVPEKKTP